MPWRTESVMDQRVEFVLRARRGEETLAALCREYEISRPTGYLWLQRYQSAGSVQALVDIRGGRCARPGARLTSLPPRCWRCEMRRVGVGGKSQKC